MTEQYKQLLGTVIYKDDGMNFTSFYSGSFDQLMPFNKDSLEWRKDKEFSKVAQQDIYYLTLGEIAQQLKKMNYHKRNSMLTIFVNQPLKGQIFQMGNYGNYVWYEVGRLRGYA